MRMKVNPAQSQWETSSQYLARAERSLTGGVSSPFRRMAPVPLYFRDGSGCRLEDVDGHCYIDYGLAWGPLILGHRHPALVEALRIQADRPHDYGAPARAGIPGLRENPGDGPLCPPSGLYLQRN